MEFMSGMGKRRTGRSDDCRRSVFAEDGFVLDHYDEVNDLAQCISPKLLEITNASDIFM